MQQTHRFVAGKQTPDTDLPSCTIGHSRLRVKSAPIAPANVALSVSLAPRRSPWGWGTRPGGSPALETMSLCTGACSWSSS